jgi:DNA topoisomerase-1
MGRTTSIREIEEEALVIDPIESAKAAGLRYVNDTMPGIRRERKGEEFVYIDPDGEQVRDEATLARIRSLAIPPAWTDVWICPAPRGHLQATGRDAKGRKQYRYHPKWRATRDETKYGKMVLFGRTLPKIRERIEQDLALPGLPREKVLATVVRLLETTFIRVGNEEYARANRSYGLTTMRDRHVEISGSTIHFHFRGKSGKYHDIDLRDRALARIVKRCQDIPGQELFQYYDENGERRSIGSQEVNEYLHQIAGTEFTAKDFRTWAGTVLAAYALRECGSCDTQTELKKNIVEAVKKVSEQLGNTPAVCRKCYIHPAVLDAYIDGTLLQEIESITTARAEGLDGLRIEESVVLEFLSARTGGGS